ncbi:hypothetical protein ACIP2Z_10890 [Streptomyces iakyrus]|uniref:Uncharacterized protein n=1 Tax=Streptomyces iakyrus TaxID=68219 RepID=A0ABW8FBN3_9ACTN
MARRVRPLRLVEEAAGAVRCHPKHEVSPCGAVVHRGLDRGAVLLRVALQAVQHGLVHRTALFDDQDLVVDLGESLTWDAHREVGHGCVSS